MARGEKGARSVDLGQRVSDKKDTRFALMAVNY